MAQPSLLLSSLAVAALVACASSTPSRASLDALFAEIQVHEAGLETARAAAQRPEADCAARCDAAASAARHTRQLCDLSQRAADADALARCERAREIDGGIAGAARAADCRCAR
jgi:hypothetical protein